jgi:GGDEF domain-containing protein
MSGHSPLPWRLLGDKIVQETKPHITILRFTIAYKDSAEYLANIKYTVDALNSYDKHRAVIKELSEALAPFAKAGELFGRVEGDDNCIIYDPAAGSDYDLTGTDLLKARAALAAAKESEGT